MNEQTFALLPKGAIFVNTARGSLVDESALIHALRSGHVAAAGLDVFVNEPKGNEELTQMKQVFVTPHMASSTVETRFAMGQRALANIEAVLAGRAALDPL